MDYSFMPLNLISVISTQLVFAYACVRMLDIKHPIWFIVAQLVCIALAIPVRAFDLGVGALYGFAVAIMPMVVARDTLPRRVFVTVCCVMVLIITEMPTSLIWNALAGVPLSDHRLILAHMPEYLFVAFLHVIMIMTLYALVELGLNRFVGKESDTSIKLFIWFALVQMLLMFAFQSVLVDSMVQSWDVVGFGSLAAAVCVVVDAGMFILFAWFSEKEKNEKRAALMKEQLEAYLRDYEVIAQALEETAKMRHDLRNQIQVVYALINRGDYDAASYHLGEMQAMLQAVEGNIHA